MTVIGLQAAWDAFAAAKRQADTTGRLRDMAAAIRAYEALVLLMVPEEHERIALLAPPSARPPRRCVMAEMPPIQAQIDEVRAVYLSRLAWLEQRERAIHSGKTVQSLALDSGDRA